MFDEGEDGHVPNGSAQEPNQRVEDPVVSRHIVNANANASAR